MNRLAIVVAVVAALVVAFVVLRPSDDDPVSVDAVTAPAEQTTAAPAPAPAGTSATTGAATTTTTPEPAPAPKPKPKPKPKVTTIRVENLKPVGGVRDIKLDKGDMLRFDVRSDRGENIHLHGYDVAKPVAPGKTASFSLRANLTGVFELELENSAVPIAEVTVNP